MFKAYDGPVVGVPSRRDLPAWVSRGVVNGRGALRVTPTHYFAAVQIGNAFTEAIVDTGGARTMIDKALAEKLRLEVEVAGPGRWFGSFWGPAAQPIPYYGRVAGPI